MKDILARFEKLSAAHGLTAEAAAAMRGLLQDAHTAGFAKHMVIADAADAAEQDAMPGAGSEAEPEDDEPEEATARMVRAVRKEVRKAVRKGLRTQKKSMRKEIRKIVNGIAAVHPGAAELRQ